MRQERRKGAFYSAWFHAFLLILAVFGLPSILSPKLPEEPQAITVELLPISEMTNIKPSEPTPEPQKKPEKPAEKQQAKPSPPVKSAETKAPLPPAPVPAPKTEEKKEKPKEKEKEKEKKPDEKKEEKKKPKEDDLEAILKAVRETAQKEKEKEKPEPAKSDQQAEKALSTRYDETMPLSMSEIDAIRSQIAPCWNVPAGAKDAHELVIVIHIELDQTGALIKVELANESKDRYSQDSFFRAAADSAIRAVRQCTPLKGLPADKFQTWRSLDINFNPKEMLF